MFKKTFNEIVAIMAVTMSVTVFAPVVNHFANTTVVAHADASTLDPDGPWETSNSGDEMLQQVHNGNEIYYSIAPNDTNTSTFQDAVSKWNALGVIKLVQVNWNDSKSQITMQSNNDDDDDDDSTENGSTSFTGLMGHNGIATIGQAQIQLYASLNDDSSKYKSEVAAHEIGHALGFDHDNRRIKSNGKKYRHYKLVMNAESEDGDKVYKLGGIEQHMLEDHYNLTASVDLSNMNC